MVTLVGLQLPILFGGAVIMENTFALPGLGRLMLDAPDNRHVRRYPLADPSYRHDGDYDAAIELAAVSGVRVDLDHVR